MATQTKRWHKNEGKAPLQYEQCTMLYERSEEPGDNGGCENLADFYCATCGTAVCRWHTWSSDGHMLCAVCYGIQGWERPASSKEISYER